MLVHIAVKLPVIRRALGEPLDGDVADGAERSARRSGRCCGARAWRSGLATVVTAGQTIPLLRRVSVLAPRSGQGPARCSGEPVGARGGRAAQCAVAGLPVDGQPTGRRRKAFTRRRSSRRCRRPLTGLPIACVEGWSVNAEWTGVVLADLVAAVGASPDSDVRMISLEPPGPYSRTDAARPARPRLADPDRAEAQRRGPRPRPRVPVPVDRADETRCAADEVADPDRGGRHDRARSC